jgi:NAD+ kinase
VTGELRRVGLVVHPRRDVQHALAMLRDWCAAHDVELVGVATPGSDRQLAEPGDPADCDAIVALGGDGTTLAAVRVAAPADRPVMGVACGSLGALTAVTADHVDEALDRVAGGDWIARRLPALEAVREGAEPLVGVNDIVLIRQGAGQIICEVRVGGELFVRFAGDGLVLATPLGSSAYTLAAGGPVVALADAGLVCTPVAPHGGCCPPLVTGPRSPVEIRLDPGYGGARVEVDGQVLDRAEPLAPVTYTARLIDGHATVVMLGGEESLLAGLRRRRILMDSPRLLARDDRAAAASGG